MIPITLFKLSYTPVEKGKIRWIDVYVVAEDRKEAERIALEDESKFFDSDCTVTITEHMHGYRAN